MVTLFGSIKNNPTFGLSDSTRPRRDAQFATRNVSLETRPQTALGLGFLSSVLDNIPLTALALKQGGYDWAILAYAVGFGGSMI